MLKITTRTDARGTTLELEGKLAGPWVEELENFWKRGTPGRQPVKVLLNAVTFIDKRGKALLTAMHRGGAELAGEGCMTRAIVEEIIEGPKLDHTIARPARNGSPFHA
jgi:hypothetical protein